MEGFQTLDILKGVEGNDEDVFLYVIIDTFENGETRVIERRRTSASEKETVEYVKPVSEIRDELERGVVIKDGSRAESVEAARDALC